MSEEVSENDDAESGAKDTATDLPHLRDQVRELILDTFRERKLRLGELRNVAKEVVRDVRRGFDDATDAEENAKLRAVVDGVADSFMITARAARLTMEEAIGRGAAFTSTEIDEVVDELETHEKGFTETVSDVAGETADEASESAESLGTHIRRTAESVRKSTMQALDVARQHPVQLAGETAAAAVRATRSTAEVFLSAFGGAIQAAAKIVAQDTKKKEEEE